MNLNQQPYEMPVFKSKSENITPQNFQQQSLQGQKWAPPKLNFEQEPQKVPFLQDQFQRQQKLSWQNPESGVNHFEYSTRYSTPQAQAQDKFKIQSQFEPKIKTNFETHDPIRVNWPNHQSPQAPQNFPHEFR